jgi:hypothetical protein
MLSPYIRKNRLKKNKQKPYSCDSNLDKLIQILLDSQIDEHGNAFYSLPMEDNNETQER